MASVSGWRNSGRYEARSEFWDSLLPNCCPFAISNCPSISPITTVHVYRHRLLFHYQPVLLNPPALDARSLGIEEGDNGNHTSITFPSGKEEGDGASLYDGILQAVC